jgi:hypothetical protein
MTYDVLNLGAGWQSSRVLLAACRGELPRFDVAVFADTQWEPKAVYANVAFLAGEAAKAGIPLVVRTRGDLRADAIEFRRARRSADGKRFASIPTFIRNLDGSQGRVKRQCTREYKIEVVEEYIRRELLGLAKGRRVPKGVTVRQWFGISDDEASRATFPGIFKERELAIGTDLFGKPATVKVKKWFPAPWKVHVYPLLNETWHPDRTIREAAILPCRESRADCGAWLAKHFPDRTFPRSACVGCPFRSNEEWRDMRDNRPEEWADACDFDEAQRVAHPPRPVPPRLLFCAPSVHRQLVPLREADLCGRGEAKGGGCGTLFDGQDGLCDV